MATALVFMGMATLFSGISGGLNAKAQQQEIEQKVCQMYDQMQEYKKNMATEVSILSNEAAQSQQAAQSIMMGVSNLQSEIQLHHSNYKKTYNQWVVISVVFLILLIFIFASKKLILHATTEGG